MKKKRHPLANLLMIPAALVIDIFLVLLGTILDDRLFAGSEGLGHPFPVFTLIFSGIACIFSVVMLIISVVHTVKGLRKE